MSLWVQLAASYRIPPYFNYYSRFEETDIDPERYTTPLPANVNGSRVEIPRYYETTDYRVEEQPYYRYLATWIHEENRPYRLSPFYKSIYYWDHYESPNMLGCTCTTVYKRLTLLATCAVLTRRHVLTTATSTELILRRRRHFLHLEDILGVWYDYTGDTYNSSMYATVGRITYHPKYLRPELVNRSHPFPMTYDLALWTMTHRLYGGNLFGSSPAATCERGSSYWLYSAPPTPHPNDLVIIVGFQFIRAFRRPPLPWVKYGVRTRNHLQPCPKTEWGWFHCISTTWAKLGLDHGANMHRTFQGSSWLYDGLLGMNTLSIKLRSIDMVHYFLNLDSHSVLDFLYDAYMGLLPYEFLDYRFENVPYETLKCKDEDSLWWNWEFGEAHLYKPLANY